MDGLYADNAGAIVGARRSGSMPTMQAQLSAQGEVACMPTLQAQLSAQDAFAVSSRCKSYLECQISVCFWYG